MPHYMVEYRLRSYICILREIHKNLVARVSPSSIFERKSNHRRDESFKSEVVTNVCISVWFRGTYCGHAIWRSKAKKTQIPDIYGAPKVFWLVFPQFPTAVQRCILVILAVDKYTVIWYGSLSLVTTCPSHRSDLNKTYRNRKQISFYHYFY